MFLFTRKQDISDSKKEIKLDTDSQSDLQHFC